MTPAVCAISADAERRASGKNVENHIGMTPVSG
jgi:hypothetical protein